MEFVDLDKCWYSVYGAMVAALVREYSEKEWGPVDERAMDGIISKAKAIANLHNEVL